MGHVLATTPRFQVQEAAGLIGTNPRRLEGWVEQGFIEPRIPGKGKGSRHSFDVANVVEGILLLEIQEMVGQKSPYPGTLMESIRAESPRLAEQALGGWRPVVAMLTIQHKSNGQPQVFVSTSTFDREDEIIGDRVRDGIRGSGKAVTFVGVHEPLGALVGRLRAAGYVAPRPGSASAAAPPGRSKAGRRR